MNEYKEKLKNFKKNMQDCIKQVWQELSIEQKEIAEEILIKAWEEEDREGFQYTDYQILASFLSKQILYPCYDAVFKAIFLMDEDHILLKDLIYWTIFQGKRKVSELTILPTEPSIGVFGEKIFRCDIIAVLENNEKCNIEMQVTHHEGLCSRMVIQAAKLHVSQAKKGMEFIAIKPTLSLWIMPFDFTSFENCYSSARLRFDQEPKLIMSNDIQFHFFEFCKPIVDMEIDGLGLWRSFFSMKSMEDYNTLKRKGDIMLKATNNLASLSNNPNFRKDVLEESFKELGRKIEIGAYYEKGRKEGKKEGKEEGKNEGKKEAKIEGLELLLKVRFGEEGLEKMAKIREVQDLEKLDSLFLFAMNIENINAFEEGLDSFL